jgi:hypothetical protein
MEHFSYSILWLLPAFAAAVGFVMAIRLFVLISSQSQVRLEYTRRMHGYKSRNVIFGHFMGGDGAYHKGFTSKKGVKEVTLQSVNNP